MTPDRRLGMVGLVVALAMGLVAALVTPFAAAAAEPAKAAAAAPPGKIADFWIFWPQAGHEADFEAAVKTHVAWRKQAGEPFAWEAYQPIVGSDLGYYVFRSGEHHWPELDAEAAWGLSAKADAKFREQMMPHVARYEHYLAETDYDHSNWVARDDYKYFWVQVQQLVPGGRAGLMESLDKLHKAIVAAKWPVSYSIDWSIGGAQIIEFVFPYVSYAAMQDPDPPLMKVLADSLGSADAAKAVLQQFDAAVAETTTTIYVVRPDLATPR